MLVDTPQITWHGGEAGKNAPILSLDVHPLENDRRRSDGEHVQYSLPSFILATAGTDAEVRLWIMHQPTQDEEDSWEQPGVSGRLQSFIASLGGHERGVNVVRFSPDGLSLASASDGGTVVIWSVDKPSTWGMLTSDRDTRKTILRGATEDIYDLSWSPDCKYIACGSIDRRVHLWEVSTKRSIATLEDHANYVQGTAWDPLSKYVATQSNDRSCRIYHFSQTTQDGCNGNASRPARITLRMCHVIKSCTVCTAERPCGDTPTHSPLGSEDVSSADVDAGTRAPKDPKVGTLQTSSIDRISSRIENKDTAHHREPIKPAFVCKDNGNSETTTVNADTSPSMSLIESGALFPGFESKEIKAQRCGNGLVSVKDHVKTVQRKNLFVDETATSFFRRLAWSPDGAFLIAPSAQYWDTLTKTTKFCTYLFTRGEFTRPAACLPGLNKPSVAVRCNPRLFALKISDETEREANMAMCDLPYRAVFAVVSLDAVVVYDTQHSYPLTVATGLHYSGLTDACWSADGLSLFVSSTDGYISKFHFKQGELGSIIPDRSVPFQTRRLHPVIYKWRQDTTENDESSPAENMSVTPIAGAQGLDGRKASEEHGIPELRILESTRERGNAVDRDASSSKPKKKIVPTLLSSLPATSLERNHEMGEYSTSTSNLPAVAFTRSPSRSDNSQADRKKRRITPTLVYDATPSSSDGAVSTDCVDDDLRATPSGGDELATSVSRATIPATEQIVRTSKKKRLTPTLVSSVVT